MKHVATSASHRSVATLSVVALVMWACIAWVLPASPVAAQEAQETGTRYVAPDGEGRDIVVIMDGPDLPNDCLDQGDPCATIGHALEEAVAGETISLLPGEHTATLTIAKDITLSGAGTGAAATVIQRHAELEGGVPDRVITVTEGTTVSLANLTVRHGQLSGEGAGIRSEGTLSLQGVVVADNGIQMFGGAVAHGGGIWNSGTLVVEDSMVTRNVASGGSGGGGGGIWNDWGGTLTIAGSTVSHNSAGNHGGGAILNSGGATISGSVIEHNDARDQGAGIWNRVTSASGASDGVLSLSEVTLRHNRGDGVSGGAISSTGWSSVLLATVTIEQSLITDNGGVSGGGTSGGAGINLSFTTLTVTGSTISANTALPSGFGGGFDIANNLSDVTITNSTIAGNVSSRGGGIRNRSTGIVTITNSVIVDNQSTLSAFGDGGGIHTQTALTVSRSVIAGNTAGRDGDGIYATSGATVTATLNWWGDASGPAHADENPEGSGDAVVESNAQVIVAPWLAELDVVPDDAEPAVGATINVAATIRDSAGQAVSAPGLVASFVRTGQHPGEDAVTFASSAVHTYTGTCAGTDTVDVDLLVAGVESGLSGSTAVTWGEGECGAPVVIEIASTISLSADLLVAVPVVIAVESTISTAVDLTVTQPVLIAITATVSASGDLTASTVVPPSPPAFVPPSFDGLAPGDDESEPAIAAGGVEVLVDSRMEAAASGEEAATVETSSERGAARVEAPPGSLPEGSTLSVAAIVNLEQVITQAPPPAGASLAAGFVAQVHDAEGEAFRGEFAEPVKLQFTLTPGAVPADASPGQVVLAFWNGTDWSEVDATVTMNEDGSLTVMASVMHFTLFAAFHQPQRGLLTPFPSVDGVSIAMWGGGPFSLLPPATSYWVTEGGVLVGYMPDAPDVVNGGFRSLFPDGRIPPGRPLLVVR